jgi:hypothetical protein
MGEALIGPQPGERRTDGEQQPGSGGGEKAATIQIKTHRISPVMLGNALLAAPIRRQL